MRQKPSRPLSWRKKLVFSVVTTLGILTALELGLIFVGVRPVTDTRDPLLGFSHQLPLMELVRSPDGEDYYQTAAVKLVWFNAQQFPKQKAENCRRVFCLGGSTTYGHPYDDNTSFCGWLRESLPLVDATGSWEVINCGGISYASYRVVRLMEELANYQPDLFVVYSVHNEFLERRTYADILDRPESLLHLQSWLNQTRTFALMDRLLHQPSNTPRPTPDKEQTIAPENYLSAEVDEILNHTIGPVDYHRDEAWRQRVLKHYQWNLNRMVDIAQRAGAKIVFVTPASNERNCSPFKSEPAPGLSAESASELSRLLEQAATLAAQGEYREAEQTLISALKIDPEHAEAHYRLGQAYWNTQNLAEAEREFKLALNYDVCPLRALPAIEQAVRKIAQERAVALVDFEAQLRQQCRQRFGHGCLGDEFFLDHVHPTIDVNQWLAGWIIEELQQQSLVGGRAWEAVPQADKDQVAQRVMSRVDNYAHGVSLRNLAKVLHWSGKFAEAAPRASDALELIPNDPESRFVLADCLKNTGDVAGSLVQYDLLFSAGQDWGRAYLPYGELLLNQQDYTKAKTYLLLAVLREPQRAYVHYLLGKTHLALREYDFAYQSLAEANRLYPNDTETLKLLEQAKSATP